MNIRRITKLFNINPKYLVSREDRSRWINVLRQLEQEDEQDVISEYERVMDWAGPDKPKLYYLESVRRNLMIKRNDKYKRSGVASNVKEALKGLFA